MVSIALNPSFVWILVPAVKHAARLEAAVFRAVVAGVEVVEAYDLVVNSTAVTDLVVGIIFALLGGLTVVRVAVSLL